ncbi:crotonase/enoyl-CoA hydratase family protein [Kineosporia sp. A_224]|uniref:crotonase/enoyl-CoA hydratase family protein n=1 Tax=Kineosporia sp. A_224 TaxID=1962180 RepID=UPI000B4B65B8|nr:crotonase/enoyl-CoA hydratase family protein [Kineosporia sp. A_224]
MTYECFEVERDGKVAHVRLSRPDALNTMTPAFWRELPELVTALSDAGDVRAVVLSSTGKHFCAGMDLSVFMGGGLVPSGEPARNNANRRLLVKALQRTSDAIEAARMPVVAAVQGGCIGGALSLVTACDLRYASADAFFVLQETNIGMTADVGALQRLPRIVGDGVARELAFTGRRMPAARAREVGLVTEVFDTHEALVAGALDVAHEMARHSPLVLWGVKESLNHARDHSVAESLDFVSLWQTGMLQTADMATALMAKQARTDPEFEDLPPAPTGL